MVSIVKAMTVAIALTRKIDARITHMISLSEAYSVRQRISDL